MKWGAVSKRERVIVMLGAIAIGGMLFSSRLLPQWKSSIGEGRSAAAEAKRAVALARSLIAAEKWLHDSATARGHAYIDLAAQTLTERSLGAAGAELAELVNGAAADAGVRVGATQVLSDTTRRTAFQQVAVRTAVTGDISGLVRLFASFEEIETALAIRELSITQMNVAAGDREPEMLRAEFTVAALMRPGGGPQQ